MYRFYRQQWAGWQSLGLLVLRLVVGTAFILHGWPKIQNPLHWMGDQVSPIQAMNAGRVPKISPGNCMGAQRGMNRSTHWPQPSVNRPMPNQVGTMNHAPSITLLNRRRLRSPRPDGREGKRSPPPPSPVRSRGRAKPE